MSVCLSVRDGCGGSHNEFAGRVQNYHVRSSCHRNGLIFLEADAGRDYSALQKMPLWTLAIVLVTGKNTRLFGVLDKNKTRFSTYVSQRAESKTATVTTSD